MPSCAIILIACDKHAFISETVILAAVANHVALCQNIANNHPINKNDLLKLFKKYTQKEINITPIDGHDVDKSFIDTRKLIDYEVPSYDHMIFDMVKLIKNNNSLYMHYKIGDSVEK